MLRLMTDSGTQRVSEQFSSGMHLISQIYREHVHIAVDLEASLVTDCIPTTQPQQRTETMT